MNIEKINLSDIDDFENHPYKLKEDEELHLLMESIRLNGLITPLTVRRKENGRYEMISGHRRKRALELLMIYKADAYVYDLTDDEATIMMVDSNIYREQVLPSEKAFACKMKLEALKHQGIASGQVGPKSLTTDLIGLAYKESGRTIKRYIRLTYLIPELLKIVDDSYSNNSKPLITMKISIATEISYLTKEEQKLLLNVMEYEERSPSLEQAIKIRRLSAKHLLDFETLEEILTQLKGNQKDRIAFSKERFEKILPKDIANKNIMHIEKYVLDAISFYKKYKSKIEKENL